MEFNRSALLCVILCVRTVQNNKASRFLNVGQFSYLLYFVPPYKSRLYIGFSCPESLIDPISRMQEIISSNSKTRSSIGFMQNKIIFAYLDIL
jgi:hypothetical protein